MQPVDLRASAPFSRYAPFANGMGRISFKEVLAMLDVISGSDGVWFDCFTPGCNTGVIDTSLPADLAFSPEISIDWFTCTFRQAGGWSRDDILLLCATLALPLKDYESGGGFLGYGESYRFPWGIVGFGGDSQAETCCFSLNGSGIAFLLASGIDPLTTFRVMIGMGAKVTRFDIALDDYAGFLSYERLSNSIGAGAYVSTSRAGIAETRSHVKRGDSFTGRDDQGFTFYVGSRQSETFARIYNKAAEQKEDRHHVRVELEIKGQKADATFRAWLGVDFAAVFACGLARRVIDFKEPGKDSNVSRHKTCAWWEAFLSYCDKIRVVVVSARPTKTVESVINWIARQVAPSLFVVYRALGPGALARLAEEGRERLSLDLKGALSMALNWQELATVEG